MFFDGTLFWREKNGKSQLVLLDHGLYKQIDDDFRITHAKLWKSLLMADIEGIKARCTFLGVKEMHLLLAAMLTSRPFDVVMRRSKTKSFTAKDSIDSASDTAMIRDYAQQYLKEIIQMLDKVPRQMLLLVKMNDCLRHLDYALGSPANMVAGKYAAQTVYDYEKRSPSVVIDMDGNQRAAEVDDQQIMASHMICSNPHGTGDCIRAYLQLAPEAAEQQDSDGMTPF